MGLVKKGFLCNWRNVESWMQLLGRLGHALLVGAAGHGMLLWTRLEGLNFCDGGRAACGVAACRKGAVR